MSAVWRLGIGARTVKVGRDGADGIDAYQDRLMKMLPADAVGLYLVGSGVVPQGERAALTVWALVCLAAVATVRIVGTRDQEQRLPTDWVHVGISSVAFIIWVYTLGGPFRDWNLHVPWIGSLLLLAWTFFVPLLYKGPQES